jgi:hypothetical protein
VGGLKPPAAKGAHLRWAAPPHRISRQVIVSATLLQRSVYILLQELLRRLSPKVLDHFIFLIPFGALRRESAPPQVIAP